MYGGLAGNSMSLDPLIHINQPEGNKGDETQHTHSVSVANSLSQDDSQNTKLISTLSSMI